ncbi:MAG: bL35 family ribosomal protein [Parcubacteria group bacterium]
MARKTFSKRFKITKTGKIMRRQMGLSHFKSKKNSKIIRNKRSSVALASADRRQIIAGL